MDNALLKIDFVIYTWKYMFSQYICDKHHCFYMYPNYKDCWDLSTCHEHGNIAAGRKAEGKSEEPRTCRCISPSNGVSWILETSISQKGILGM